MTFIHSDCETTLKEMDNDSIDLIVTDPPYGLSFMGKDWDKALVSKETWKECYRVLKEGKLAFVMCSPRQDVLARMIINLQDAGFRTNYSSIYWSYASGFPKAANVSKLIDKQNGKPRRLIELELYVSSKIKEKYPSHYKLAEEMNIAESLIRHWIGKCGDQYLLPTVKHWNTLKNKLDLDDRFDELIEREEAEREIIGIDKHRMSGWALDGKTKFLDRNITKPATEEAKKMEGAYVGFQPKPAVEVILVVSKGKTLTWLDDCRIPYQSEDDVYFGHHNTGGDGTLFNDTDIDNNVYSKGWKRQPNEENEKGRFPANILVSDDVLNDGKSWRGAIDNHKASSIYGNEMKDKAKGWGKEEFGSYSRYFSLDSWWSKTFPFLIVPKASKAERNKGLEGLPLREKEGDRPNSPDSTGKFPEHDHRVIGQNHHPTVKPLKLMSYLITMGSREGDLILDPFCGSGTTCIAAEKLHRRWIGIEMNKEYIEICNKRMAPFLQQLKLIS